MINKINDLYLIKDLSSKANPWFVPLRTLDP